MWFCRLIFAISLAASLPIECAEGFVPCDCDSGGSRTTTTRKQHLCCAGMQQQEDDKEIRSLPHEDESWFVKTEQFCRPFPEVKPHLEAHREWVAKLRAEGSCITSGYRVDAEGKPGGGGLVFFAARNYDEAEALVRRDPLVANGCVDWRLNGWIAEVGEVQLR
uniref:YCII-related domain-containing protein n=1 Tax=Minutocellus polymorphus TaxID=265543 RepID=A0A7S0ANC4_9STRA|mmetsp:Transcript_16788/g.27918  ORF Transcript_16788/g.27918 Transcript_16788/m.27918 type:complete len:164 (+) Transcript_16788:68-559(+)|eukprot:CAMPEP_0197715684 /NCGR_PEP_ID=MMETSP1434-20131217/796_1 /TAXON_ID=265543 /ORGANISM="Minutocellus polymorphus, Strain CCMP3303" /LENGTH=163 /DNA_ID=CAMNT_0043299875 /DNA_START=108 /DNA_END=599 /DNA_ORIENTATION=-